MSSPQPSPRSTGPGNAPPGETTAKAKEVANETAEQAKRVAGEAQDQARRVAGDIADHARDVMDQTRSEVRSQANQGTQRVAGGLRTLGQQLQALREGRTDEAGPLKDYADQARHKVDSLAARLDARGIDGVASDLTAFARRRPGLFLLGCAGAGFAVARLVRSSQAATTTTQGLPLPRPEVGDGARVRPTAIEADMAGTAVFRAPSAP